MSEKTEPKILEKATAQREVDIINEVRECADSYEIHKSNGWSFSIPKKYGVVPKVGDETIFYGEPFQRVQGVDIAGKEVFFHTKAELEAEHQAFVKAFHEENRKEYKEIMEKIKNDESFETIDISGMSGSYEWGCQIMLREGIKFLKEHPDFHFDYQQYRGIYGVATTNTPWGKMLDKAITDVVKEYGSTGAMHQAVINHLMDIHKEGYEGWLNRFPKERRYIYPNIPAPKD